MNESKWAESLAEGDGKEALARARAALVRALEELEELKVRIVQGSPVG